MTNTPKGQLSKKYWKVIPRIGGFIMSRFVEALGQFQIFFVETADPVEARVAAVEGFGGGCDLRGVGKNHPLRARLDEALRNQAGAQNREKPQFQMVDEEPTPEYPAVAEEAADVSGDIFKDTE